MPTTRRWSSLAIWLVASAIAAFSCSLAGSAAHLGSEYVPVGNDSFYHARRILDAVADPAGFYQFDAKIHAPEGSLLVWPWGYDYVMAGLVRLGLATGISDDPLAILAWIPVAAVFLSIGLLVSIARQLNLSAWPTTLVALCMALATTTQLLHGVGAIDHHYAEMIFLLGALAAGLAWLRHPASWQHAALLAVTLGAAPAIHNGLFVLQLPLLATVFALWLQGNRLPQRTSIVFAGVLVATTLAISIPSLPLRLGRFEFYTLSWFHPYVAGCTAVATVLMSRLQPTRRGLSALLASSAVLLVPAIGEFATARTFLAGMNQHLEQIGEMQSPARTALTLGSMFLTRTYSYLIYLAPLTAALCVLQCWRDRGSTRLLFWVTSLIGLTLLALQLRMHYWGDFALYTPWLVMANDLAQQRPQLRKKIFLLTSLALVLLYAPMLRYQIASPIPPGNDPTFASLRPVMATLGKVCAADPGIVLADNTAGHYIRYYTECSVIADNFLLTAQHFRKVDEVRRLFALPAAELLRVAPEIKYVLVRPWQVRRTSDGRMAYRSFYSGPHGLMDDLLINAPANVPPSYRLLDQVVFAEADNAPYLALYRVELAAPRPDSASE
jgi:hypothetical protein